MTFAGTPVSEGSIRFDPADTSESASASARIENGTYAIDQSQGLLAGKFKVSIYSPKKTGKIVKGFDGVKQTEQVIESLPARYNEQSELTVELTAGENTQDFKLER